MLLSWLFILQGCIYFLFDSGIRQSGSGLLDREVRCGLGNISLSELGAFIVSGVGTIQ